MRFSLGLLILGFGLSLTAQTINKGGVVNAASQAIPGLPDAAIAQGSVFLINGTNLGDSAQAGSPLDVTLGSTSVNVTVGGTTMAAPIVSTSPTQVVAIMPSGMSSGTGTVTVTANGNTSPAAPVQVAAVAFGIYTLSNTGAGPAQITDAGGNPLSVANPAQPGQPVIVSGTGLGASSTDDISVPSMNDLSGTLSITVYVGVKSTTATYAGRAGTAPGQDQIAFTIPADAIQGCSVPIVIMVNGAPSNFVTTAISAAGGCSDANGFTPAQISQLQQVFAAGGSLNVASVSLSRSAVTIPLSLPPGTTLPPGISLPPSTTTSDSGNASFNQFTAAQFAGASSFQTPSVGSCMVLNGNTPGAIGSVQVQGLNAGPSIAIAGAKGTKQLTPTQGFAGGYSAQLGSSTGSTLFLDPGTVNASGPGGPDVGTFQVAIQVPPALTWPSPPTTVTRANGVTVNWSGGAANTFVTIIGISTGTAVASGLNPPAGFFLCIAPANAGTFFVPPVVTSSLPASASSGGQSPVPNGFMSLQNSTAPVSFTATGIDIGTASASTSIMQPVTFQ